MSRDAFDRLARELNEQEEQREIERAERKAEREADKYRSRSPRWALADECPQCGCREYTDCMSETVGEVCRECAECGAEYE